jgi:transcriptional antiterminator NusG
MNDDIFIKRWYVIQAYTGFEDEVKKTIEQKAKEEGISDKFGEIIIPKIEVDKNKDGQPVGKLLKKYMPGYVFVEMHLDKISENLVKSIPRVAKFIGSGKNPVPIPLNEIEVIKQQMLSGEKVTKKKEVYRKGDTVKIIDGPFANFTGEINEINQEKRMVKVMVSIFGRQTSLELMFSQVEHT